MLFLTRAKKSYFGSEFNLRDETDDEIMQDVNSTMTDLATLVHDGILESDSEQLFTRIVQMCLEAILDILRELSQHYKSLFRIAHHYFLTEDYQFSQKILSGSFLFPPNSQGSTSNGEISTVSEYRHRFDGLFDLTRDWDVLPDLMDLDAIFDRPGSFITHMLRSTQLLINVNKNLGDAEQLFKITMLLSSEAFEEYLCETDQENLGKQAMEHCFNIHESRIAKAKGNRNNLDQIKVDIRRICNKLMEYPIYKQQAQQFLEKHDECITID
ncbi:uncharacterized protein LOC128388786 [Panonychus citri]|uniref:uncharacterized protein LOC128388786 n=1 Tax=Panonychus citri TaxID=50023 RepID=UPI0023081280|nr:uncharacterized protein LOC128388786 [Panonychus citri]